MDQYILDYQKLEKKVSDELTNLGQIPKEKSNADKMKTWSMLQVSTMSKKDVPHLAELMINGSTMGITQTTQDIKTYNMADRKAIELGNELISLQQNHIDRLKNFL